MEHNNTSKVKLLDSRKRVRKKNQQFASIFGYLLVSPVFPGAVLFGPQEESDAFERKLDKCIADKVDYFAFEYGYDSEEKRKQTEAMTPGSVAVIRSY